MARREDKEKAILLRKQGLPYSEIRKKLGVSKSTLSIWLRDYPLSREQINELRGNSPIRIEKFRETMAQKREVNVQDVYKRVAEEIGAFSKRDLFIAGLMLYWGEGGKTQRYTITFSNTDAAMVRWYISWLQLLEVPEEKIKVRLQLYEDMDAAVAIQFWKRALSVKQSQFVNPYFKKTLSSSRTYPSGSHGTCNIIVHGKDIADRVHMSLRYVKHWAEKLKKV